MFDVPDIDVKILLQIFIYLTSTYIPALLYDHLYKTVLPECQKREMVTKIGANYADTGASTDGNGYVEEKSRTAEGNFSFRDFLLLTAIQL